MANNDLISIIIPFKNTEAYLVDCIESIIHQSFKNWEVIAVDDASDDKSFEILKGFAKQEERIKVFKNEGYGIIPALQTAYKHAAGTFVTRMDSDDIMKPNRLKLMVESLLNHGEGHIAIGQVKYFSERGISDGYDRYEKWLNELTAKGTNFSEIYKECVVPSPCWMVYKKDFETCGGFSPMRYPEDYDLTFRFYQMGLKVIPCKTKLHLWRDYDTRTSRTHEHYAQNYFLDIKSDYFLKLDHDPKRPLVIWGAGFKGKAIAKKLISQNVDFTWLCDNPNKINKQIYGQKMQHYSFLKELNHPQSIITVANETAQKEIRSFLTDLSQEPMLDYFFFC